MKSRNLVLGAFATVFAIGSAFAFGGATSAFVWVKYSGDANFTCKSISQQCTNLTSDANICRVDVVIDSPAGTEQVSAHPTTCTTTQLRSTNATALIYDDPGTVVDAQ